MIFRCVLWIFALAGSLQAALFDFPTQNHNLIKSKPEDFFMYVNRDFEGVQTKAWEGGTFGYVRNPQRIGNEIVCAKFHEGIDIAPLQRDAAGNPLDDIMAAANGIVVHTSREAGASNYGRYIVIEHLIEGSPVYTLYAHLSTISVESGQHVKQGDIIARMGFTGSGIDRERAHLHFEIDLMWNSHFEAWYNRYFKGSPNKHGIFHGYNLIGLDPAAILLSAAKDSSFSFAEFIKSQDSFYKITIPETPEIIRNYHWIANVGEESNPPAWTISFNRNGVPISAIACHHRPSTPELEWVSETPFAYHYATRGMVTGSKGMPRLTDSGKRFAELIALPE